VAGGYLVGGGEREFDLAGGDRGEQRVSDGGVDGAGPHGPALGVTAWLRWDPAHW
jgi:hypothetical protein